MEEQCSCPVLAGLRQCCHQFACRIPATQLNHRAPHQQKLKRNPDRRVVAGSANLTVDVSSSPDFNNSNAELAEINSLAAQINHPRRPTSRDVKIEPFASNTDIKLGFVFSEKFKRNSQSVKRIRFAFVLQQYKEMPRFLVVEECSREGQKPQLLLYIEL